MRKFTIGVQASIESESQYMFMCEAIYTEIPFHTLQLHICILYTHTKGIRSTFHHSLHKWQKNLSAFAIRSNSVVRNKYKTCLMEKWHSCTSAAPFEKRCPYGFEIRTMAHMPNKHIKQTNIFQFDSFSNSSSVTYIGRNKHV